MEQQNKEFEVPQWLKDLPDYQAQGWRAFAHKRIDGHADGLSICFNQRYCLMTHTFLIADRGYMKSYLDEYHRQTSIIRHLTESTTVATSARTPFVVPRSPCTVYAASIEIAGLRSLLTSDQVGQNNLTEAARNNDTGEQ